MSRPRDIAFETLAEVTDADWNANRGELNISLKTIREMTGLEGEELAMVIRERAADYRVAMPDVLLTPTALMTRWRLVEAEAARVERSRATNQSVTPTECDRCGGDRFVTVALRDPVQTPWMKARGIEPDKTQKLEEVAPCPDCNPIEVSWRTYDGRRLVVPDPAAAREMMRR